MAVVNTTQIAELMREHFETPFTEAMDRDLTLFDYFPRDTMIGNSVQWKIHVPNRTDTVSAYDAAGVAGAAVPVSKGTSYIENQELTGTNKQKHIELEVFVKLNYVGVQVSGLAQAATRGAGAYMETLAFETKEALEDLKDSIDAQIKSDAATNNAAQTTGAGNGNADIDGFRGLILKGSGAGNYYGGLAIDSYPYVLKPYVLANGGTDRALTLALMQQIMTEMELPRRTGAKISDILCARVHFYQYGNLLSDYRRWVDASTLDGGFTSLAFENTKVTPIPALAAGDMFFIDKRSWGYYVLQNFETRPQSVQTDADRYVITHYSQLVCKHLGQQAAIADLLTS